MISDPEGVRPLTVGNEGESDLALELETLRESVAHDFTTTESGIVPLDRRRSALTLGAVWLVLEAGWVYIFTGFALLHGAREGLASEHDATSIDVLGHDIDDERAVRVALGASRYASLRRRGRALSIDDVIELAERLATHLPAGRAATAPGLSAREREVLALLVGGRTNRQIAAQLMLSARTVETHVQSLYRRLGVHGRAEAAAVAVREALI